MYYYLYKIINKINGKFYIGVHKTSNLEDDYMGSSKILTRAINKYGIDNFTKEILEYFDNEEQMYKREKEIVNPELIKSKKSYNVNIGGHGFYYINNNGFNFKDTNPELCRKNCLKMGLKGNVAYLEKYKNNPIFAKKMRSYLKKGSDKALTKEIREKIKETFKRNMHAQGEKNSQYGTYWAYNLETNENKKFKNEILPKGWVKGRICKKGFKVSEEKKKHLYGVHWGYNLETKKSKKFKKDEILPEGWVIKNKKKQGSANGDAPSL